jgi:hypothetical protein
VLTVTFPVLIFQVSSGTGGNKWKCHEGTLFDFSGHNAIIDIMSVNSEGVIFSGSEFLLLSATLERDTFFLIYDHLFRPLFRALFYSPELN